MTQEGPSPAQRSSGRGKVSHEARGRGGWERRGLEEEEEEEEESLFKADAVNEEDSERDRATQV